MRIQVGDRVSHAGVEFQVRSIARYLLPKGEFRLCELVGPDETVFLVPPSTPAHKRVVWFRSIPPLDITTPPPKTIAWRNESYLLAQSGPVTVTMDPPTGQADSTFDIFRYRAAGDAFLHIESATASPRMLAGHSVSTDLIEIRPA